MDQRERIPDFHEALKAAMEDSQANLWTALPGIVESFNAEEGTCKIQPTIQAQVRDRLGKTSWVTMPLLLDVPVIFPQGGAFAVTFPIAQGDEALVVFSSRCIDAWWQQSGIQPQVRLRMHDLSDGFAIVGPLSKPRMLTNISTTTAQLRLRDGSAYIELTADGKINLKAPGGVHVTGAVQATGEGTFNSHTVGGHTHTDPQGGNTGTPTG